jgi:hypothetical protein
MLTKGSHDLPGMTLWQLIHLSTLLNGKSSWAVTSLQVFESIDRNSGSSSRKLQQSALLLGIPGTNALPEELDDLICFSVSSIVGVLLPVVDINLGDTSNEQFQLSLIKDIDEICRDELVKTADEVLELFVDPFLDSPLGDESISSAVRLLVQ